MHFRLRKKGIQVIRTRYDAASKRAKSEIVGRIPKASLEIPESLAKGCTPAELDEVTSWIEGYSDLSKLKQELAAKSLPEQFALASEWFAQSEGERARGVAMAIQQGWVSLRAQLKKRQLLD